MKLKTRDGRYWIHGTKAGQFLRLPLGTANQAAAASMADHIERALTDSNSERWPELKKILPPRTFTVLANLGGYTEREPVAEVKPLTWDDLQAGFRAEMQRRITLGKLAESTVARYEHTVSEFDVFTRESGVSELAQMNRAYIEQFKMWRMAKITQQKCARGGKSLSLDVAILHRIFAYAVENEMLVKNPVRFEGRPGDSPENGAQPFRGEQVVKLRQSAGDDLLAFLLLRWTGLRGSDAVRITWDEIDWQAGEINRLTQKRKKRVVLPVAQELLFALQAERERRKPQPDERILLNPTTRRPLTRPRLYCRMLALGKRAGVADAHPHRYRDTFAVDLLARGATPYDVAKLLGDTVDTVEKHYAPFVKELRDRARRLMENGEGIEQAHCTFSTQRAAETGRIQ